MNYKQVRKLMRNSPLNTKTARGNDSLFIERYEFSNGASDDYQIVFKKSDSTVVELYLGD
jgi:hypothetical protein